jgi:hypothetical protein
MVSHTSYETNYFNTNKGKYYTFMDTWNKEYIYKQRGPIISWMTNLGHVVLHQL